MAVTRWDPWGQLAAIQRDLDEAMGLGGRRRGVRGAGVLPPMDAFRTEDGTCIRLELPGIEPDQVEVSVEEGVLTVRGERHTESEVAEEGWLRRERASGTFERSFALPEGVDVEAIEASFTNGVLELLVPHPPERRPHRIPVATRAADREAIDVSSEAHGRGSQQGEGGGTTG